MDTLLATNYPAQSSDSNDALMSVSYLRHLGYTNKMKRLRVSQRDVYKLNYSY
jgi:hypothetical protein